MQIESMFVVVKGITMTGVTVGLILNNIEIMIHGGRKVAFDTIAWFELFAFFWELPYPFISNIRIV